MFSLSFSRSRSDPVEDKDRIIAFTFNTWGDDEDDYIKRSLTSGWPIHAANSPPL